MRANLASQNTNDYHDVYQSLETSASIVARVQTITTNPNANAGLILRHYSSYVYLLVR